MKYIHAYRHALARASIVFKGYAAQHRAKIGVKFEEGTPGAADTLLKAEANDDHAKFMDDLLAVPVVYAGHADMVTTLQKPGEAILAQMTPLKIMCLHMAGGAASEGGELFDAIKRWALFGKELDRANVVEELGDLEFFMEGLRQNLDITREETLIENMSKLVKGEKPRYPGGVFSDAATIARADKTVALATMYGDPSTDPYVLGNARNPDGTPYVGAPGLYAAEEAADEELLRIADEKHAAQMADLEPEPGASEGLS